MKSYKKILSIIIIFMLFTFSLIGCSNKNNPTGGGGTYAEMTTLQFDMMIKELLEVLPDYSVATQTSDSKTAAKTGRRMQPRLQLDIITSMGGTTGNIMKFFVDYNKLWLNHVNLNNYYSIENNENWILTLSDEGIWTKRLDTSGGSGLSSIRQLISALSGKFEWFDYKNGAYYCKKDKLRALAEEFVWEEVLKYYEQNAFSFTIKDGRLYSCFDDNTQSQMGKMNLVNYYVFTYENTQVIFPQENTKIDPNPHKIPNPDAEKILKAIINKNKQIYS